MTHLHPSGQGWTGTNNACVLYAIEFEKMDTEEHMLYFGAEDDLFEVSPRPKFHYPYRSYTEMDSGFLLAELWVMFFFFSR